MADENGEESKEGVVGYVSEQYREGRVDGGSDWKAELVWEGNVVYHGWEYFSCRVWVVRSEEGGCEDEDE